MVKLLPNHQKNTKKIIIENHYSEEEKIKMRNEKKEAKKRIIKKIYVNSFN